MTESGRSNRDGSAPGNASASGDAAALGPPGFLPSLTADACPLGQVPQVVQQQEVVVVEPLKHGRNVT